MIYDNPVIIPIFARKFTQKKNLEYTFINLKPFSPQYAQATKVIHSHERFWEEDLLCSIIYLCNAGKILGSWRYDCPVITLTEY